MDKKGIQAWVLRADTPCNQKQKEGTVETGVQEWVSGGGHKGGLKTAVNRRPPGVIIFDEKTETSTEAHAGWTTEAQAVHAYHRGRGWPTLAGWNVDVTRIVATKDGIMMPPGGAWMIRLATGQPENGTQPGAHDVGTEDDEENPKGVKLAEMQRYLAEVVAPAEVRIDKNGKGPGTRYTQWRVLASDIKAGEWMKSFGTQVDTNGNKMEWASGWSRYKTKIDETRKKPGEWKTGDIGFMSNILAEAGEVAMGQIGGGGEPPTPRPRDRILKDLLKIQAAVIGVMDPLTSMETTANRTNKLSGPAKELLQRMQQEVTSQNANILKRLAKKWKKKLTIEIGLRYKAGWKARREAYERYQNDLFENKMEGFIKLMTGKGKNAGPGGAAFPRDKEGNKMKPEEAVPIIEGGYSGWCKDRVMEAPTDLEWYDEVFGHQAWADGTIYLPLMVPITEEEVETSLKASGSTAPGPSGLTTEAWRQADVVEDLTIAFNDIINRREWPEGLVDGLIFPIAKKWIYNAQ